MIASILKHVDNAIRAGASVDYRYWRIPSLLLALAAVWTGMLLLSLDATRESLSTWSADRTEQTIVTSDHYDVEHPEWARSAPSVTWIDFDEPTVSSILATEEGHSTKDRQQTIRKQVAQVLSRLRNNYRPRLVFLDLSPLYRAPAAEQALISAEIAAWNKLGGVPLAIYAGAACNEPQNGDVATLLEPHGFGDIVAPTSNGAHPLHSRVIWSCPIYGTGNGESSLWTCAYASDGSKDTRVVALPSPGWFAFAVRTHGSDFANAMQSDLRLATQACLDDANVVRLKGTSTIDKLNHVRFSFDPVSPNEQGGTGTPVVQVVSASLFLTPEPFSRETIDGRIVVIGASDGSRGINDTVMTRLGPIPGPLMVAADMRATWVTGIPEATPWWTSGIAASLFVIGAFAIMVGVRALRATVRHRSTPPSPLGMIFNNEGIVSLAYIVSCAYLALGVDKTLVGLDFVRIGFSIIVVELLFTLNGITEEISGETDT